MCTAFHNGEFVRGCQFANLCLAEAAGITETACISYDPPVPIAPPPQDNNVVAPTEGIVDAPTDALVTPTNPQEGDIDSADVLSGPDECPPPAFNNNCGKFVFVRALVRVATFLSSFFLLSVVFILGIFCATNSYMTVFSLKI